MRHLIIALFLVVSATASYSQSCDEIMSQVKANAYGTTYTSYGSTAISEVTFYQLDIDYETYYFAIVCFKNNHGYCSEYIYQVGSNTESYYARNYRASAGRAYWNYIAPHGDNLGCSPD